MYVIFLYNTFKTFIDNMELLRSEYFTTEESIMDSTITTELLEKEIVRLREENKKLTDQLEFVCLETMVPEDHLLLSKKSTTKP